MYEKIVGEKLDLNIEPDEDEENYWEIEGETDTWFFKNQDDENSVYS